MQNNYFSQETLRAALEAKGITTNAQAQPVIDAMVKKGAIIQGYNDQNLKSNQSVANKYGSEGSNVPATTIEPNPIAQSFGKTVNNLADRATQVGSAVKNVGTDLSNAQTLPEAAKVVGKNFVSATGAVGAGLNDIIGGGIAVAAKGIDQMSGGKLGDIGSKAVASLLNTETGKRAVQAISEGAQSWSDFEKANPEESKVYSDIFNTLNIVPTSNIIKAGVKSAVKGAEVAAGAAENVVNMAGDIVAQGVKSTFEAGKDIAKNVPKVKLSKDTNDYLNKIYKDSPLPANEILSSKNKVENALGMFKTTPLEVTNVKTGAKEAFNIEKATPQQIFEAVNNLSKNVTDSHKTVLKELSKTPDNLVKDFSDVQTLLEQKFNDGYISKALKTKILKQLDATGGNLDKIDDWIVNANKYFGSQADTRVVAQDVAKLLRAKLENVVDRAGYADSFGSVQELKRLIINSIAKETKNQELLKSVADNGIDVAFNVLTKNPIGLAIKGTQGLKKLFGSNGDIKLIKKAGSKAKPTSVKGTNIKDLGGTIKSELNQPKRGFIDFNAEVMPKKKVVSTLEQEAKKYKSAEEFVKAQPTVYHGTNTKFDVFDKSKIGEVTGVGDWGDGFYFSDNKDVAKSFAKDAGGDIVMEVSLKNLKFADGNKLEKLPEVQDILDDGMGFTDIGEYLKSKGYDGVKYKHKEGGGTEYVVYDADKIKTKSQLTDIWNKANKKAGSKANPTAIRGSEVKKKLKTTTNNLNDTENIETDISMSPEVNSVLGKEYTKQDIISEIDKIKNSGNYYDKATFNDFIDNISNGNRSTLVKLYRASKVAKNTISETLQKSKNKGKLAREYDKIAQELGNFKNEDALSFIERKISEYEYAKNSLIFKEGRLKKLESELKKYSR